MTTIAQIILAIALVLSIILPFGYLIGEKNLRVVTENSHRRKRILLLWHNAHRHRRNVSECFFCTGCCRFWGRSCNRYGLHRSSPPQQQSFTVSVVVLPLPVRQRSFRRYQRIRVSLEPNPPYLRRSCRRCCPLRTSHLLHDPGTVIRCRCFDRRQYRYLHRDETGRCRGYDCSHT